MRFWIDTEYDDSGDRAVLISLGAVAEDGREFYAVSSEFDPKKTKPWVQENVLPYLPAKGSSAWKPLKAIAREFTDFVGEEPPEFWSLIATYDWYLVTHELLGGIDYLPHNWPFECWDLHEWAWRLGASEVYPQLQPSLQGGAPGHEALRDARGHRRIYDYLVQFERDSRSSD